MAKKSANGSTKAPTKSEVYSSIAQVTELSKKQVAAVFDELGSLVKKNLGGRGPGIFTVPGLCKMVVRKKPATKAGERKNPFTGEMKFYPAKPASKTVRVRPLKGLKDMVK